MSIEHFNNEYNIYENLFRFIEYRGYKLEHTKLPVKDFLSEMRFSGRVEIIASETAETEGGAKAKPTTKPTKPTTKDLTAKPTTKPTTKDLTARQRILIVFHNKMDAATKKVGFIDLLKRISQTYDKIFLISPVAPAKAVVVTNRKYPNIYIYTHDHFIRYLPDLNPCKHYIMTDEEIEREIYGLLKKQKSQLSVMPYDDPANIWLGGKIGDVVKVLRPSYTIGESVGYRHIQYLT